MIAAAKNYAAVVDGIVVDRTSAKLARSICKQARKDGKAAFVGLGGGPVGQPWDRA